MTKFLKIVVASLVAVFAVSGLTGCSSEPVDMSSYTAVIDVRTPEEYATGHLDGAILINVQDSSFASNLATLDPAANYFVYCRSGNRSGQAIEKMKSLGFTGELRNGGGVSTASATSGLPIVVP
jgi:phage shock protein E